jgi:hypothetical protein
MRFHISKAEQLGKDESWSKIEEICIQTNSSEDKTEGFKASK